MASRPSPTGTPFGLRAGLGTEVIASGDWDGRCDDDMMREDAFWNSIIISFGLPGFIRMQLAGREAAWHLTSPFARRMQIIPYSRSEVRTHTGTVHTIELCHRGGGGGGGGVGDDPSQRQGFAAVGGGKAVEAWGDWRLVSHCGAILF